MMNIVQANTNLPAEVFGAVFGFGGGSLFSISASPPVILRALVARATGIVSPEYMTFRQWADGMILVNSLSQSFDFNEEDWQKWGEGFLNEQNLRTYTLPNPSFFNNWQDWAQAVTNAMSHASY